MPVHDWRRVDASVFHDFHNAWITELRNALNRSLLPSGYYALGEQHAGQHVTEVLTLRSSAPTHYLPPPRTLAIRQVSGHRLVALVEIVSPSNKDRPDHVAEFVNKATSALELGIHVLLVDLFPPGPSDPHGMHGAVWGALDHAPHDLPVNGPLILVSYSAVPQPEAYLEYLAVGGALLDMPLFLRPDCYINVPLEATYQAAFRGVPEYWRDVLAGWEPL